MNIQENTVQVDSKVPAPDGARFARSSGSGRVARQPAPETLAQAGQASRSEETGLPSPGAEPTRDGFSPDPAVEPAGDEERDIHPLLASLREEGGRCCAPAERPAPGTGATRAISADERRRAELSAESGQHQMRHLSKKKVVASRILREENLFMNSRVHDMKKGVHDARREAHLASQRPRDFGPEGMLRAVRGLTVESQGFGELMGCMTRKMRDMQGFSRETARIGTESGAEVVRLGSLGRGGVAGDSPDTQGVEAQLAELQKGDRGGDEMARFMLDWTQGNLDTGVATMTDGLDALKGALRVAKRLGPRDAFASGKHDRGLATAPLASRAPWHEYSDTARPIPPLYLDKPEPMNGDATPLDEQRALTEEPRGEDSNLDLVVGGDQVGLDALEVDMARIRMSVAGVRLAS